MTPFGRRLISESQIDFKAHLLTRPPRLVLLFALVLMGLLGAVVVGLIAIPWRQTVIGHGQVSIFDPVDRPQTVDSQLKGRLIEVYVQEGDMVEAGQVIAKLEDRDTKFLDPHQKDRLSAQISALDLKQTAASGRIDALYSQREAIEGARVAKRASAQAKIAQTKQKLVVNQQFMKVGEQDVLTAKLQEERITQLEKAGLKSKRDLELTIQKRVEAETKLQKMKGELQLGEQEIQLARLELANIDADASEKTQKVGESLAKVRESIAETEEKIQKLSNEMGALSVRRSLQTVVAPRSGKIVNLRKLGLGQLIKEGQTIATIVPEAKTRGVELYLAGLDAPLVQAGVPVRLMFEGFPAVPFAGWDWASVGTFGGRVVSVDPVNTDENGKSGFRVWVMPDPEQPAWPGEERLRLGSKANGWLQLQEVPLYYELWRQLNAFPAKPTKVDPKDTKTKPVIRR